MARLRSAMLSAMTKRRVLVLVGLLLLLYGVVPRVGSFSDSFSILSRARPVYIGLALIFLAATYCLAAAIYWSLTEKLAYRSFLAIQLASGFTNRLLPASLGTLTLYVQFLRKSGRMLSQAIAIVSANNIIGLLGHGALLAGLLLFVGQSYTIRISVPGMTWLFWALAIGAGGIGLWVLLSRRVRQKLRRVMHETIQHVAAYRKQPALFYRALGFSCALTAAYAATFWCSALAVGISLPVQQVFLVFTVGVIAGSVAPTPGGLIGAEAGLTGGLIAYGVGAEQALAAALLYRFLTYWLPLVPGLIVLVRIRRLYS